jgi:hypothetical protein
VDQGVHGGGAGLIGLPDESVDTGLGVPARLIHSGRESNAAQAFASAEQSGSAGLADSLRP